LTAQINGDILHIEGRTPKCLEHPGVLVNALAVLAHDLRQTLARRMVSRYLFSRKG
jgi:hypothetical protein